MSFIDEDFKHRLFSQTIDSLKNEETVIEKEISHIKMNFSNSEISRKESYITLCKTHSDLTNT